MSRPVRANEVGKSTWHLKLSRETKRQARILAAWAEPQETFAELIERLVREAFEKVDWPSPPGAGR